MHVPSVVAALCALATPALAQLTVDYPDSTLAAPAGQYPIYTGTATNVIRGQIFCPSTFAGLPGVPMICTRIGVQLAETGGAPVPYAQFVMRAGATPVPALTPTWNTNLPDQRVQADLSGQNISGGAGANIWVEFPLVYPFYWQPGDSVVLDITSQAAIAGQYLRTAIGTGVPRMISTSYTGQTTGTPSTSGGIKFRMVFEPLGLTTWGAGCAGSGSFVPTIGSTGQSSVGSPNFMVTLSNALGGTLAAFSFGSPAEIDLFGGCIVYNNLVLLVSLVSAGTGPGGGAALLPLPVPNAPALAGAVLDVQWIVLDPGSASPFGVATSPGGKIVIY